MQYQKLDERAFLSLSVCRGVYESPRKVPPVWCHLSAVQRSRDRGLHQLPWNMVRTACLVKSCKVALLRGYTSSSQTRGAPKSIWAFIWQSLSPHDPKLSVCFDSVVKLLHVLQLVSYSIHYKHRISSDVTYADMPSNSKGVIFIFLDVFDFLIVFIFWRKNKTSAALWLCTCACYVLWITTTPPAGFLMRDVASSAVREGAMPWGGSVISVTTPARSVPTRALTAAWVVTEVHLPELR